MPLFLLAAAAGVVLGIKAHGGHARQVVVAIRVRNAKAEQGLDVLPFPGTPDAAPGSRIMFPALRPDQIGSVSVAGSASGQHAGRVIALPGGRGTAFVPLRAFAPGERVSVHARVRTAAAAAASGEPRGTTLAFRFRVARPVTEGQPLSAIAAMMSAPARSPNNPASTPRFHSAPNLDPPEVRASGDHDRRAGDVFLDAQNAPQTGPMILNSEGHLVWFRPIDNPRLTVMDVRVQRYRHQPVLTYWEGRLVPPFYFGRGVGVILDRAYHQVHTIRAGDGYQQDGLDEHEFVVSSRGTAFVTLQAPVRANLSRLGGPRNGIVLDSIVQEIDIATNRVVWEWHSLGHVPLSASYAGRPIAGLPYDFFHINSIERLSDGSLLISARNTWAVYDISQRTGKVIWSLGGKDSSFKMTKGTNFEWQHDARVHPNNTLTVFDDAASPKEEPQSRALSLSLNVSTMRAEVAHVYTHQPSLLSQSQGSVQVLPDGNVFVGWGSAPAFTEYSKSGRELWSGAFVTRFQSYRAYRAPWHAQPTTRPALAVTGSDGPLTVYASWNGATDVVRWQVLAGSSAADLSPLMSARKSGFETAIRLDSGDRYLQVRALSTTGRILGSSRVVSR